MKIVKNEKQIFKKMTVTYSLTLFGVALAMEICFVSIFMYVGRGISRDNLRRLSDDAVEYCEYLQGTLKKIRNGLYQNEQQLQDVTWLLNSSTEEYLNKKLEYYSNIEGVTLSGTYAFANDTLARDVNIRKVSLVGLKNGLIYSFKSDGNIHHYQYYPKDDEILTGILVSDNALVLRTALQNPDNFEEMGYLQIEYDRELFGEIEQKFKNMHLLIISRGGEIIYASEPGRFENDSDSSGYIDGSRLSGVYSEMASAADLQIVSYIGREHFSAIPVYGYVICITAGLAMVGIGMLLVHRKISVLSNRLAEMIVAMEQAMKGDLNAKLETGYGDELDIIAGYFNEMCVSLDAYIQRSYIAALEQKNTELLALQNQINPHFLYNTLEAIRMQALCNNDKDVGAMLYSLAVLFRGQIKDSFEITLEKELDYCRKYIELFNFRYNNRFTYEIELPEEFRDVKIIKLSLQPIIENYFVHGIRLEAKDNHIGIYVTRENDAKLCIRVTDNGMGADAEALKINPEEGNSIGLANVHRRLINAYGPEFGLEAGNNEERGITVIIRIPITEKTTGEKHV